MNAVDQKFFVQKIVIGGSFVHSDLISGDHSVYVFVRDLELCIVDSDKPSAKEIASFEGLEYVCVTTYGNAIKFIETVNAAYSNNPQAFISGKITCQNIYSYINKTIRD